MSSQLSQMDIKCFDAAKKSLPRVNGGIMVGRACWPSMVFKQIVCIFTGRN